MRIIFLVKEVRKRQGKTLEHLSVKSGVSATHINDIENNLKNPSLYAMIKLAKALNVSITDLYKIIW